MKHAFLIIAHNNWEQLKLLISLLDSKISDIFIHINSKVKMPDIKEIENSAKLSNVLFVERRPIVWGEYGILDGSLVLLNSAIHNESYDYYHLLTGSDLPLKSINRIDNFFLTHVNDNQDGKKYTNYLTVSIPNKKIASRIIHYNLLIPLWGNKNCYVRKFGTATSTLFCKIQDIFGVDRFKNSNYKLYQGSSWWSISHEFALYVIKEREWIRKQFKWKTFAADEFAFQILIMNSEFKNTLYIPKINQHGNLRLLDFSRGNGFGSPHIYHYYDKEEINKSDDLFARKFDIVVDKQIIDYIVNRIMYK